MFLHVTADRSDERVVWLEIVDDEPFVEILFVGLSGEPGYRQRFDHPEFLGGEVDVFGRVLEVDEIVDI